MTCIARIYELLRRKELSHPELFRWGFTRRRCSQLTRPSSEAGLAFPKRSDLPKSGKYVKVTKLQKYILFWDSQYPGIPETPDIVPYEKMRTAERRFRVRIIALPFLFLLFMTAFICMIKAQGLELDELIGKPKGVESEKKAYEELIKLRDK